MRTANPTKTRKPYKITKPRERWNEQEHEKFLEAIAKFGRDWKQIVSFIGTRSVSQVRSHAQKHFIRLEKKGLGDVVPPARRKARWAEKRSAGLCDNPCESDQDFSALHQQASSSSVSTFEHQAMHPLLGAPQNLDGRGSSIDYSDCQPLSSRTHSLGSLASRNTSFTSPASQTDFITYAQEMLLHRQEAPATTSASAGNASAFNAQPLQPEQRQFIVDMLQQLAAQQQAAGLSSAPFGVEGLSGNNGIQAQQRLRQLLQQQQQHQEGLPPGGLPSGGLQEGPLMGAHQPAVCSSADTWPWKAPATAPTAAPISNVSSDSFGYPSCGASPTTAAVNECLPAFGQQPATPRLDGAFLAECFRSPRLAAAHNLALQNITSQSVASQNLVSQNLPSQNLLSHNLPSQNSPNASVASTAHCYTSSSSPRPSCDSCLPTTKAEPLQHGHMTHADENSPLGAPLGDVLGLEDIDFWGGIGIEDPLIQAVEAAMGCTDESENSCFIMTTEF